MRSSRRDFQLFIGQYRIILSADTASEVRQLPERCLSRKAGIMRCCHRYISAQNGRIHRARAMLPKFFGAQAE